MKQDQFGKQEKKDNLECSAEKIGTGFGISYEFEVKLSSVMFWII